jgi:hypothetical protein
MKKSIVALIALAGAGLLLSACGPKAPTGPAKPPALKSALSLDTASLAEFDDTGCSTDGTTGKPWGNDNIINKFCLASDATNIYVGVSARVEDSNNLLHFISIGKGGTAADITKIDAWPHKVSFTTADAPPPNFFVAVNKDYMEVRKIDSATATTKLELAAGSAKVVRNGFDSIIKAKIPRSVLGTGATISGSMALVGGDNYGGGVILPATGNFIEDGSKDFAITFSKMLSFGY